MDTRVTLFGEDLINPIIPASGTFGFGYEFADYYDINKLGGISLKGTTLMPRYGNPLPRIAECPSGLLNAIGLQNPGVEKVISEEIPRLRRCFKGKIIANVGGHSFDEYVKATAAIGGESEVFAVELNISCPNVDGGGITFGTDAETVKRLVKEVKTACLKPIIVKLSPNVTDITALAAAAEDGGADAISLINTLIGMRIDLRTGKPVLSRQSGGYSGPGIFPVAIRMVHEVFKRVSVPIIGMGGISSADDVLEMFYAGATAVMVGSANLVDPFACEKIVDDLPQVMKKYEIDSLKSIIGRAHE